jgi:predicted metal-dependent hydrolase
MTDSNTAKELQYQIRINRRARRAQIKVTHAGQVVVVLPCQVDHGQIANLVDRHRSWIDARLSEQARRIAALPEQLGMTPSTVHLCAIGQRWQVCYGAAIDKPWRADSVSRQLLLRDRADDGTARDSLLRWLHLAARRHLSSWLAQTSQQTGLVYSGLTIRAQKTRWGSCSSTGNINLNRNLLFLPAELVEYLLVHELCHTRHPNHSPAYWALVEQHLDDYRQRDQALRQAVRDIPLWAQP